MDFYDLTCAYLADKSNDVIVAMYKEKIPKPKMKIDERSGTFRINLGFYGTFTLSLNRELGLILKDKIEETYVLAMEFFHGPELLVEYRIQLIEIVERILQNIEHMVYGRYSDMNYCNRLIHDIVFMKGNGVMVEEIEKMFRMESERYISENKRAYGF
jgi:hypothetical protein